MLRRKVVKGGLGAGGREEEEDEEEICRFYPCLLNGPSSTLALLTARTMQEARERCFFCKVGRPARERRRKRGEQREGRRRWALTANGLARKNSSCEPPLVSVAASFSTRLSFLPCPPSKSTSPSAFRLKVRAQMSFHKFSRLWGREKTEEPLLPTHFVMPQCKGEFASNAKKNDKEREKKRYSSSKKLPYLGRARRAEQQRAGEQRRCGCKFGASHWKRRDGGSQGTFFQILKKVAFFGLGLTELFGGGGAVGRDLFLFFFVFRVFFLAFDVSGPPSVLVEGNYEAPAVFKHKGLLSVLLDRLLRSPMREFLRFLREKAREREGKERERKKLTFFPLFQKNSGAGASAKTSTTGIMGPYSPVAYDVGCRGDSYSPTGPATARCSRSRAWVTKVGTCGVDEQFLWVGDQWLSVGSNPKTFGNSRL